MAAGLNFPLNLQGRDAATKNGDSSKCPARSGDHPPADNHQNDEILKALLGAATNLKAGNVQQGEQSTTNGFSKLAELLKSVSSESESKPYEKPPLLGMAGLPPPPKPNPEQTFLDEGSGLIKEYTQIKRAASEGAPWSDPDFNPMYNQHVRKWCRPSDIKANDFQKIKDKAEWYLFRGKPCADDVRQGILGDCWLLSSLSVLAEFQGGRFVHSLFPKQSKLCREGVYMLRLCIGGLWRHILVDDRLPCVGGHGDFLTHVAYCATKRRQLWASLVEKAYAKASGSFESLSGGQPSEALTVLTGFPSKVILLSGAEFNADEVWSEICSSKRSGFLMTCTSNLDSEEIRKAGLESQHAYSILDTFEFTVKSKKVRLLKIRNPQEERTWNGDWSENSSCWTRKLRERVNYPESAIGEIFFLCFEDFQKFFNHCCICRVLGSSPSESRLKIPLPYDEVPSTGLIITCEHDVNCQFSLSQLEKRFRSGPFLRGPPEPLLCFGFVILNVDDANTMGPDSSTAHALARMQHKPTVNLTCKLAAGKQYLLVPMSFHQSSQKDVVVTCIGNKAVSVKEQPLTIVQIQSAWAAYARMSCIGESPTTWKTMSAEGSTATVRQGSGACVVALVENRGSKHVKASLSIMSDGFRFSRGSSMCTDWLEPGQGQLVQIALPQGDKPVSWVAIPALEISEVFPTDAHHTPELKPHKTFGRPLRNRDIHLPFALHVVHDKECEKAAEVPQALQGIENAVVGDSTQNVLPNCQPAENMWSSSNSRPGNLFRGCVSI